MNKQYIYQIISQLVNDNYTKNKATPRSLLRHLLPVESAFGYYTSNKVEFFDPQQNTCIPFQANLNTRLLERDYFVDKAPCITNQSCIKR